AEDLSRIGRYRPWYIESGAVAEAASDLADRVCNRNYTVVATCPVMAVRLTDDSQFTLAPDLTLEKWKPEERAVFASRYHYYYAGDYLYGLSVSLPHASLTSSKQCQAGVRKGYLDRVPSSNERDKCKNVLIAPASGCRAAWNRGRCR